jgi:hypothetical protein
MVMPTRTSSKPPPAIRLPDSPLAVHAHQDTITALSHVLRDESAFFAACWQECYDEFADHMLYSGHTKLARYQIYKINPPYYLNYQRNL